MKTPPKIDTVLKAGAVLFLGGAASYILILLAFAGA